MLEWIEQYSEQISAYLNDSVKPCDYGEPVVINAMKYSLSAGGKRIRPILVYEFCRLCGGDLKYATPFAQAIEMIHTYSLIHDDLPCMDDDDMRRGKPSCHKQFGEAYALLAGDALLTEAFHIISSSEFAQKNPLIALKCIEILSSCAGPFGMIGGQTIDLANEDKSAELETLILMDNKKTGALISAACQMGVLAGGGDENDLKNARIYAEKIGLAFQIVDDILDVTADESQLGKPVGSDKENNKSTYVSLLGLEKSKREADKLTAEAVNALSSYGEKAKNLIALANYLVSRNK